MMEPGAEMYGWRAMDERRIRGLVVEEHREKLVLMWLCEQVAARYDHLELLIDRSMTVLDRVLRRLAERQYLVQYNLTIGERTWVLPTRDGLRACGLTYQSVLPSPNTLSHIATVNDVRLHIQTQAPQTVWVCERQLLAESARGSLVPDGVVIYQGGRVAIEVELTQKPGRAIKAKLERLEAQCDAIVYFCAPAVLASLTRMEQSGSWPKLSVRTLPRPWEAQRERMWR
jgi:hypothetical protein